MHVHVHVDTVEGLECSADQLWLHVLLQVCPAEPAVPVVRDVASVHNLAKQVAQVGPRHLWRSHAQGR